MKKILLILNLIGIVCLQTACNEPDEHFRGLIEDAKKTYPGGIDSLIVANGYGGFTLEVFMPPNGTATKLVLVNEANKDTSYYNLPKDVSLLTHKITLKNLPNGNTAYGVFTMNDKGMISPQKNSFEATVFDLNTKIDNFMFYRGKNRMRLNFKAPANQAADRLALARAGKDTIFYKLDPRLSGEANAVMIENLEEGDHNFDLLLVARNGSKSLIKNSFNINVYGENLHKSLSTNAGFISATFYPNPYFNYYLIFSDISSRTDLVTRLVRYRSYTSGVDVTVEVPKAAVAAYVTSYTTEYALNTSGLAYALRYLPANGIDFLDTDFKK